MPGTREDGSRPGDDTLSAIGRDGRRRVHGGVLLFEDRHATTLGQCALTATTLKAES